MPEHAPAVCPLRAFMDGHAAANREARHLASHASAPAPVAARQAADPSPAPPPVGVYPPVDGLRAYMHGPVVRPQDAQPAAGRQRRAAATQPRGHPRPQAPMGQAVRSARLHPAPVGLAPRGPGDAIAPGPRSRLQAFGRCGRYDSLSLDGNHVLCLISLLMVDALRPSIAPIARTPVPLPISIWMTCRSSSDRCEYTVPIGAASFRTGFLDKYQCTGVLHFHLDNGNFLSFLGFTIESWVEKYRWRGYRY